MLWPFSSKNSRLAVAVLQFVSHLFPHITPFPNQETREPQGEAHHHRHREEGKHKEPASLFPGIGKYQDSRSWGLLQNMDHLPGSFECYGGKKFTNPPLKSSKIIKNLLGGFNPSEKYESQLGLLFPIYGKSPNWMESQFMFQTTNQIKLLMKSPNHSIPMVPYRHSASSRSFPPGTSPSQCLCRVPSAARRCPRSFQVRQKVLPWRGDGTGVYSFLYASVHLFFVIQK